VAGDAAAVKAMQAILAPACTELILSIISNR
jgi:hypothetical protein